jgi:outer membrane immunogenic protein
LSPVEWCHETICARCIHRLPSKPRDRCYLPIYKAPPPSAGYDWTGFYVGGNVGYSIGRTRTTSSIARANDPDRNFLLGIFTLSPAGAAAGFQVGYNRQIGAWVIGVEADWQWSDQKDSACHVLCVTSPGNPFSLTLEQRMKWFGTARGRIGYAWTGRCGT